MNNEAQSDVNFEETTCGLDAFRRGSGQKVVGFSFYGDNNSERAIRKGYFDGIKDNLELMSVHYTNWVMRLYIDSNENKSMTETFCTLACSNSNLDICDVTNLPGKALKNATKMFPMNWRFLPSLDQQVDYFVSRDLDSRLNSREEAAVNEWLNSNKSFHIMRDHPLHRTFILGGMWGTHLLKPEFRQKWNEVWANAMNDPLMWRTRDKRDADQTLLKKYSLKTHIL